MMTVNFEQFKLYTSIDKSKFMTVNVKEEVSNGLYNRGTGIAQHALALKIYNSHGDIELDDNEWQVLMMFVETVCSPNFIDSLKELENQQKQ